MLQLHKRAVAGLAAFLTLTYVADLPAHYHILLPQSPACKRGEAVPIAYLWGHPFEHQLFNAFLPERFYAIAPSGARIDLLRILTIDDQRKTQAYHGPFTPNERGDYVFCAESRRMLLEEDRELIQDFVKVVLHVQAQKGWDVVAGEPLELIPLTRPYGIRAGMVVRVEARADGKALANAPVEIERYNPTPPKELPADEHVTYTAKTDAHGTVVATLTEPGWWCVAASRLSGEKDFDGKRFPLRQRAILWIHVDENPAGKK